MIKVFIIFTLILFSISHSVIGQKDANIPRRFKRGYIINSQGDTLFGQVNYNDILYIRFMDQKGKKKTYTAAKIKGFGDLENDRFMESYYISRKDASYFMERIVSGNFPLYFSFDNASMHSAYQWNGGLVVIMDDIISRKYISPFYFKMDNNLKAIPESNKHFKQLMLENFGHIDYVQSQSNVDSLIFRNIVTIFENINRN